MSAIAGERPRLRRYDVIVLSPHLDDAVLSVGGMLHRDAAAGAAILVPTVCTADIALEGMGRLLREVYGRMHLDPATAMAARRSEDLAACAVVGVEPLHWQLREAPDRHPDLPDLRALFSPPPPSDATTVDELADAFAGLPPAARILAPLGVGGHLDHRVVRRAAERVFGDRLTYYEEVPYCFRFRSRSKALGYGYRRRWRRRIEALAEADVAAKVRAIEAYGSQLEPLFGDAAGADRAIRRHLRRLGGERLWTSRRPSQASADGRSATGTRA